MHRATPLHSSHRAFSAGGSRSVVDKVDDQQLMQEMSGNFMKNESRQEIEAPQNYGFTSVVFDAEKDKDGKIQASAETFIGFMGGNRSFPVAGAMDDRRHRLYGMEKGDSAMYRGRGDKQQLHLTQDGGFWSAPSNKKLRLQLVSGQSEDNKSVHFVTIEPLEAGGQPQQQRQDKRGQKPIYKDGQSSEQYLEVSGGESDLANKNTYLRGQGKKILVHAADDQKVYLGAKRGEAKFSKVMTEDGPSEFVLAKIG
jgi:phage gp45-like